MGSDDPNSGQRQEPSYDYGFPGSHHNLETLSNRLGVFSLLTLGGSLYREA